MLDLVLFFVMGTALCIKLKCPRLKLHWIMESHTISPLIQDESENGDLLPVFPVEIMKIIIAELWNSYELRGLALMDDIRALSGLLMISHDLFIDLPSLLASLAGGRLYEENYDCGGFDYLALIRVRPILFLDEMRLYVEIFGNKEGITSTTIWNITNGMTTGICCVIGNHRCEIEFEGRKVITRVNYARKPNAQMMYVWKKPSLMYTKKDGWKSNDGNLRSGGGGFSLFALRFIAALFPCTNEDDTDLIPPNTVSVHRGQRNHIA